MIEFFISKNGQPEGPYTKGEVLERIQEGRFSANDLVWKTGDSHWRAISAEFPNINGNTAPSKLIHSQAAEKNDNFAVLALALPIGGTFFVFGGVGSMNLLQDPSSALSFITVLVVLGSAVCIALDAKRIGMGSEDDPVVWRGNDATPPVVWAIAAVLLWIIFFPVYMFKRNRMSAKNLSIISLLSTVAFLISLTIISSSIEARQQEVIQGVKTFFEGEERINSLGEVEKIPGIFGDVDTSESNFDSSDSISKESTNTPPVGDKEANMNEEFTLGSFIYRITSVFKMTRINDLTPEFGTFFISVGYTIQNNKETDIIGFSDFIIEDSKGRRYSPVSEVMNNLIESGTDELFSEIHPGTTKRSNQIFQLPKDALDGQLILIIPKKEFFSSSTVRVKLEM